MEISTGFLLIVLILSVIYFLPTVVALSKRRSNTFAIFVMNLLLGWSFIGWAVALVWSFKVDEKSEARKLSSNSQEPIKELESKLTLAKKTNRTDFGNYEDKSAKFEDTKIETPVGMFICHNNGTFTDVANRLMWIQAPWGMIWGGSMFRGEPVKINWSGATKLFGRGAMIPFPAGKLPKDGVDAYQESDKYKSGTCSVIFAGYNDWRLPTAKELLTIEDYPRDVCERLFPRLPHLEGLDFWSANDQTKEIAWYKREVFEESVFKDLSDRKKYDYINILFVRRF